MEIVEILQKQGLNEKEAKVYLALLELGAASAYALAPKAGLKRSIIYVILDDLQQKGLVSVIPRPKKNLYTAENPQKLLNESRQKYELLQRFMPNIEALYNAKKEKPQVLLFEGKQSVAEVYEKILQAKNVNFFCTIQDIEANFPAYPSRINKTAMEGKIKFRELLSQNSGDIEYAKKMKHGENYEHRFLPKGMNLLTDNVLCDGKVIFFSYQPYIFAVQITSKGIYESLLALFDLAWQSAEPYEKIIAKANN